jgi:hypothetical protein
MTHILLSRYLQYQRGYVQLHIEVWIGGDVNTLYMSGTTVRIASAGGWALYLAPYLQCNAHSIVEISPISARIRSVACWNLNMRSCKYIVYVRDHSWHSVNGRMRPCLAPRLKYNAHCIVEIRPIAAQTRAVEYWSQNMRNFIYIVYVRDHGSDSVNWRMCAVLAPCWRYNARWIVVISRIAAQLRSVEYLILNMRICNYIVYVRDNSSHSVNWTMCAVFDIKCAV